MDKPLIYTHCHETAQQPTLISNRRTRQKYVVMHRVRGVAM